MALGLISQSFLVPQNHPKNTLIFDDTGGR